MPNSTFDILVIADNLDNLKLHEIIFKTTTLKVAYVSDIENALTVLKNSDFKVIIYDGFTADDPVINFFEQIIETHPFIQKVLIADSISHTQITEMIGRSKIFNFINKPLDPKKLDVVVKKAIEQYDLLKNNSLLVANLQHNNKVLTKLIKELKIEEEKFRNIFNSSPDPHFIVNENGVILNSNPNAIIFCSENEYTCKGKLIFELVSDEDVFKLKKYVKYINSNESKRLEVKCYDRKMLLWKDYELISYPVEFKKTYMISFRDISERKQIQKRLMQTVMQTEEKERRRFAQELHDGVGPLLSTTKLYLQWFNKPQAKMDKDVIISKLEETLNETILSLREISNNISPNTLLSFGLKAALKNFISRINNASGIEFDYKCELSKRPAQENEVTIYRLVCELINNSLKHSKAKHIKINITDNGMINVDYEDNGQGFNVDQVLKENKGSGIINIISRVQSLGGKYDIKSTKGKGTFVTVKLNK